MGKEREEKKRGRKKREEERLLEARISLLLNLFEWIQFWGRERKRERMKMRV